MMCVIDSDYIYKGASDNPGGRGFLSVSMLLPSILKKNDTVSVSMLRICLGSIFRVSLIKLLPVMKLHVEMRGRGLIHPRSYTPSLTWKGFSRQGKFFPISLCLILDSSL